MAEERNDGLLSDGQDAVMVYIDPGVIQSMADVSAKKKRGFQELLEAAEEGDLDAQHRVAMAYCNGTDGAQRDENLAFQWFTKAAEGDYIASQYGLGLCYIRGIGTEKDPERGARLLAQAAEQGYPPAQSELGLCYELGTGVEEDRPRAVELYRQAADKGSKRAKEALARLETVQDAPAKPAKPEPKKERKGWWPFGKK